jgi:hypothetical protein
MNDNPAPTEMGFAEFTAKLIAEMFEAIVTSQTDQEHQISDLIGAAELTLKEFAKRYITDDDVHIELARLFPSDEPDQPHAIFSGGPYTPNDVDVAESPALESTLGVVLERTDFRVSRQRGPAALNTSGVKLVRLATRMRLAEGRLAALRAVIGRGIARTIVDSGRINAKISFEVVRAEGPKPANRTARSVTAPGMSAALPQDLSLVRLVVRQADERAPQTRNARANVLGEVEITFKTIT